MDFVLACMCTVIDHKRRHSVERTNLKVSALDFVSCRTFLFFPPYDAICDLLQYTRTLKRNLFVKYQMIKTYESPIEHVFSLVLKQKIFILAATVTLMSITSRNVNYTKRTIKALLLLYN